MKKLLFIAITFMLSIIFLVGCAGKSTYQPPEGCLDENGKQKDSLILKYVDHPAETAIVLKLATTTVASEVSPAYLDEMIYTLETALQIVDSGTYQHLSTYLMDRTGSLRNKYAAQLMIVTQYAQNLINIDLPIYECDKILLKKHFREQVGLLQNML